ncbi:cysteine-rich CWC family protein [Chitinophaga sp.]|uniref:cysteine-rich CWC family protein n=1 Tax=Chitinophaga sp. TaxID=1869181 RepID=UPI0031D60A01
MAEHETVSCPRCKKTFECRVGSILRCQCQTVQLTAEERLYIADNYAGCLCAACMEEMKEKYKSAIPHSKRQ